MTTTKVNHPAVEKAAQAIWNDADPFDLPTQEGVPVLAEIIERETKYSRLVEAATNPWLDSSDPAAPKERKAAWDELRSVLAEIKEG